MRANAYIPTMEIKISTQNLMENVSAVWQQETGADKPMPPKGLLQQALVEARAALSRLLARFLAPVGCQRSAQDCQSFPDTFAFDLRLTTRRVNGKEQALADTIHSYLVNAALVRMHTDSGAAAADIAKAHQEQMLVAAQTLNSLLYSKIPPML